MGSPAAGLAATWAAGLAALLVDGLAAGLAGGFSPCGKQFTSGTSRAKFKFQSQILPPEKVTHRACVSVKLNMHPNRQFPAHVVVHMPLCLLVARPSHNNWGGEGTVARNMFPRGGARIPSRTGAYYTLGVRGMQWGHKGCCDGRSPASPLHSSPPKAVLPPLSL